MRYHEWCWVVRGIGLLGGIVLAAGMLNEKNIFLCLIGVSFLLIALVVSAVKLRCPECGKRIPEQVHMRIEVCPHCGKPL